MKKSRIYKYGRYWLVDTKAEPMQGYTALSWQEAVEYALKFARVHANRFGLTQSVQQ